MTEVTRREKYYEAKREAAMRKRVFPRWVEQGRIKMDEAERKIKVMEAIAEDYREKDLFDD